MFYGFFKNIYTHSCDFDFYTLDSDKYRYNIQSKIFDHLNFITLLKKEKKINEQINNKMIKMLVSALVQYIILYLLG